MQSACIYINFLYQAESPSDSEFNALGEYLLVCLLFVICALVEFAITVLLNHRQDSKGKSDTVTNPSKNENDSGYSKVTQIMPLTPVVSELRPALPTENPVENSPVAKGLITNLRKCIPNIPATNIIDFLAFWIHLVLFIIFNCNYWTTYLIEQYEIA